MAVFKDKWNGYDGTSWRVSINYTDWQGKKKRHDKRGFKTKKEALEYERNYILKTSKDINMEFDMFIDVYLEDMEARLKLNTIKTKENIINKHIRPYFGERILSDIAAKDILVWQNTLLKKRDENGMPYKDTYLRTIENQLNAIFNHAVKYYDLPKNPIKTNDRLGKSNADEMLYWTKEEYLEFIEVMKDKPISYYAFQVLYWTGIRVGELLALTKSDFDIENKKLTINKSLQVIDKEIHVTSPKTQKSNRVIDLPQFLCDEIEDYFGMLYKLKDNDRLFQFTKHYLHKEMTRGSNIAGVKRIRIHDLRHSCCALLISLGYSPAQIADRLGHESITITQRYSHLYPSIQIDMANKLDEAFKN